MKSRVLSKIVLGHYPTAKAWQRISDGQWVVSPWESTLDCPVGAVIGWGPTRRDAWEDAEQRILKCLDDAEAELNKARATP